MPSLASGAPKSQPECSPFAGLVGPALRIQQLLANPSPTKFRRATDCENTFLTLRNVLIWFDQKIVRATDQHCFFACGYATVDSMCDLGQYRNGTAAFSEHLYDPQDWFIRSLGNTGPQLDH